jgi:glutamyl-Q tRNA(Asp) synthetase
MIVTRFAPSPTGYLHRGHAFSAFVAWQAARAAGGRFLLRLEDIDPTRCRDVYRQAILDDLTWLGLAWDGEVRAQAHHFDAYAEALARLERLGVLYPCFCTRKDIAAEVMRAGHAPHVGETLPYPGTCRALPPETQRARRADGAPFCWRLDSARALAMTGPLFFEDRRFGRLAVDPSVVGDPVLARKETPASYHLCVTVDDALQGVTLVTRGEDLLPATHTHRLLQALLDLPTPLYAHHPLLLDATGEKLSKRKDSETLRTLRAQGIAPETVLAPFRGALSTLTSSQERRG